MRVTADRDRCCSSGLCVLTAPGVFDQREEDGLVTVLDAAPPREVYADVREAAACCPSGAIEVEE